MSRILEKNGEDITNIDGAKINRFYANNRDVIVKNVANECDLSLVSTNSISIADGLVIIDGFSVFIESASAITFATLPSSSTNYQIVLKITLDSSDQPTLDIITRVKTSLVQNDIFDSSIAQRVYEVELGTFTATNSGLTNLAKTLDVGFGHRTFYEHNLVFEYHRSSSEWLFATINVRNESSVPITLERLKALCLNGCVTLGNAYAKKNNSQIYPLYLELNNGSLKAIAYNSSASSAYITVDDSYLTLADIVLFEDGSKTQTVTLTATNSPSSGGGTGGGTTF